MTSRPTRSQRRRHARQLRHDGIQPMMLVSSEDRFPETALTAIGRAIWRYRFELTPIIVAVLTAATAAMLHRSTPVHRHGWR